MEWAGIEIEAESTHREQTQNRHTQRKQNEQRTDGEYREWTQNLQRMDRRQRNSVQTLSQNRHMMAR